MVEARKQAPPGLRKRNPGISPATEAIVLKCLHPDRERRYQSARELQEDLERQLHDQPLRHAPEPSWRERWRKFTRRHPRLCSSAVIGAVAALLLLGAAGLVGFQARRLKQQAVLDQFHAFQDDVRSVQLLLTAQHAERTPWEEAVERGKQALGPYQVLDNERWRQGDGMRCLPAAEQERLREEVGAVLFMMTRAEILRPGSEERSDNLRQALHWSRLAEACFAPRPPASVLEQRAEVLRRLGELDEAERISALAKDSPPATARDRIMAAREHVAQGRFRQAFPLLQQATQEEPQSLMAWFLLARCHDDLGQDAQALACYNTCIALWPRQHRLVFNRGLAHLWLRDYARAVAKVLDRIIELYPDHVPARSSRGVLLARLKKRAEAHRDAEESLIRNADPSIQYQVAGIYALTSTTDPDDAREAFRLLTAALRRGYGLDLVGRDTDLDPIRNRPEFRRLVEAARALLPQSTSR